jgi:hypothetical protein
MSRPTRLARESKMQGRGKKFAGRLHVCRPEGGQSRSTRDRLQRHGTEYRTAEPNRGDVAKRNTMRMCSWMILSKLDPCGAFTMPGLSCCVWVGL